MLGLILFFLGLCLASLNVVAANEKVAVCYYGTWATYRHGVGKFDVDHIDPFLCTHAIYTFVGIDNQGNVISLDPYLDLPENWGRNNFGKFNDLKKKNPKLKTILAVGGWNEGSAKYSIMAANPQFRRNFINSAIKLLTTHGFDGFDVDWEYPNQRDSVHGPADIDNFTTLLRELKEAFAPYGFLLTAAVASVESSASKSYDIPAIAQYLDLINIMAYDLYGAWDPVTGHNAGLHKGQGDENKRPEDVFSVDVTLQYWLDQGCPPEKLVLGLPLYGRTFTLTDPNVNGVRAPASGAGISGPFTATNGFIGYNEFCSQMMTETWEVKFDDLAKVPYAVKERNWVSYDDSKSLVEKLEYGLKYNIAGYMVWSIETDDFNGLCHGEAFPLLNALNNALDKSTGPVVTPVTSPTTQAPVTNAPTSSLPLCTVKTTNPPTTTTPIPTTTTPIPTTTTPIPTTTTPIPTTTTPIPTTTTPIPTTTTPIPTTTTPIPTTTTPIPTQPTTVTPPPSTDDEVCKEVGFARNPKDCSSFYMCVEDRTGGYVAHKFYCPISLHWDQQSLSCNYASLVNCNV